MRLRRAYFPSLYVFLTISFFCASRAPGVHAALHPCHVKVQLSAQREGVNDGVISATLFAGHQKKQLNMLVAWNNPKLPPVTLLLPPDHVLLSQEVPVDWFNGQAPLTLERLLFESRTVTQQWHVAELPEPVSPTDPTGTGVLNLGKNSPLWYSFSAVVFTGSQLHFLPHQPGVLCSSMAALEHVTNREDHHLRLYMDSPRQHYLRVVRYNGEVLEYHKELGEWFNVSLHWDVDHAQSLIPIGASRMLEKRDDLHLELDHRVLLLTSRQMQKGELAAPNFPSFSSSLIHAQESHPHAIHNQQLSFGRRLLSEVAVAWAVDAQGHVAVSFASAPVSAASVESDSDTPGDSVPTAAQWVVVVMGVLLLAPAAYWLSYLGTSLRLDYQGPVGQEQASAMDLEEGHLTRPLDLLVALVSLVLMIVIHVLVAVYASKGTLADASLEQPLYAYTLAYWICSLILGILFVVVLILEAFRYIRDIRYQLQRYVSLQFYSMLYGLLLCRTIAAGLLIAFGMTFLGSFISILITLFFAYFTSLYCLYFLAAHVFSGHLFYMPLNERQKQHDRYGIQRSLVIVGLLIVFGLTVVLSFSIPIWLIGPFLSAANGLYSPTTIMAIESFAVCIVLLGTGLALAESARMVLERPAWKFHQWIIILVEEEDRRAKKKV